MKLYKIAVVLLALGLLTGCGKTEAPETTTDSVQTTAATQTTELQTSAVSGIPVETPYITLYCPEDWASCMQWDSVQSGDNYVLTFRLTTVETPVTLFSLTVGPQEAEGYYLGSLETDTGTVYVYSVVNEQTPTDWSEADYMELCHQQERVNELILQLHADRRFQPA